MAERKAMIDRNHRLPIVRQVRALGISRGSVYYLPRPVSDAELALMRRIDALHLEHPFAGARMLRDFLNQESLRVARKRVARLMRKMGIEALYRKPNTSRRHPGHRVYPYLLRGLAIERPNQVLSDGHYLHSDGPRLCVSGRGDGLAQPKGAGLAYVDHDGHPVLH